MGVLEEEIFADGLVTANEYERAVLATIQCIRDEGFPVEGPFRYPDGAFAISPGGDPTKALTWQYVDVEDEGSLDAVEESCRVEWSLRIERVWTDKHAPSEAERQAWLEKAWACAEEKSLPLSDPPTEEEAISAVSPANGCRPWETTE